jgi:hypothetical protein
VLQQDKTRGKLKCYSRIKPGDNSGVPADKTRGYLKCSSRIKPGDNSGVPAG